MFSMCGLLCRFLRGWRQNEAVGVMVHAATSNDSSLLVENISYTNKNSSETVAANDAVFCQPFCAQKEEKLSQLLWRDNNKHATVISPKEKVDIEKWSGFSSTKSEESGFESVAKEPSCESPTDCNKATPNTSRKASTCSDCEHVIPFLLEASFNESEEKSFYGYNVIVEQLAEPYAWKLTDVFAIILYTTPTKLVTLIHAFFNHALLIKEGLRIQKILTIELTGKLSTFEDPSTLLDSLISEPKGSKCTTTLPHEVDDPPNSNTLIPTDVTSPGCDDSLPASPLFEEEEDFEILKNESEISNSPPNVLIYTSNNAQYFESVKNTFLNVFSDERYAIYHLTDEIAFKSPWKLNTKLLVVCGDVATHVSTVFIRFLLSGGKVFSVCSDFLNVAVPLFGNVEFQEAAVISMSYSKWKNVQLLHHQHCFHSSPKHKNTKALEKKSNTGSAVSVEPTFVEITDEYGVRHRLDLKVLAKDDTWGAPSLLVANVSGKSGKALFSQVHLEQDPNQCITCELKGEQLKKSNESRLEILRHLLSTYMDIEVESDVKERRGSTLPDYTPAYLLGRHELKQKFVDEMSKGTKDGMLLRHSLSISFHNKEAQSSIPSRSFLPILLTGYTKEFSTVKYFEELNTSFIGRLVVFCEVLSSTMNVILGKAPLEDGIVVIAIRQREGRGRYGNLWLSPLGCTMFSLQLHFSASSNMGQCLPFLQHLMSLAMVTAVTEIPGYKDIPLRLKWPNDIYLNSTTKIGGVIVEASIQGGRVIANLGCGINLSNTNPTSCINAAIREYNATTKAKLAELTYEVLCARIFNQAESLIKRFQEKGADEIIKEYYNYWLHGNAQVTVNNEVGKSQTATITGIDQYGYLKATLKTGEDILLHPDGNSFNMMEGLIYHKKVVS